MKGAIKMESRRAGGAAYLFVTLALASPGLALAAPLVDGNSAVTINTTGSAAGISSWQVDGVENVKRQWFWYQPLSTGPQYTIDSIGAPILTTGLALNALEVTYANNNYGAKVTFTLQGSSSGSGHALLNQTVVFTNLSSSPVTLFDYSDFDLAGSAGGQSILLSRGTGSRVELDQLSGSFSLTNTFISGTKIPTHLEANVFGVPGSTLDRLQTQNGTVLNDNLAITAGDVTGSVQWSLAAGASVTISKVMIVQVPEPSTIALMGLGVIALVARPKRQC